ncbi:MAG TPA: hypothetical protein DCL77_06550 [Prolixibacteraceae bacterium]|jgi:hypothetical protein|nr:hypothetical protein [Prolixibacteraceae bacterium]
MKIKRIYRITLLVGALIFGSLLGMAQKDTTKLKQEVEVSKNFQPSILDVDKINDIPKIKAEQTEPPTFQYSIFSKPVYATFDLTPVAAAKMVGEAKPEMENGLLKLGLGNYMTPYGELFYNVQPDKNSNFGMHFMHLSSNDKLKLLNGDNVKAPQSDNEGELFGQKFFKRSTLSGRLSFNRKAFNYYGYAGGFLTDLEKDQMIPYFEDKQHFTQGTGDVHFKSGKTSADNINFDLGINYHYFVSKTEQKEHQTVFSAILSKKFNHTFGLLDVSVTYYGANGMRNRFTNAIGQKQQTLLKLNPSVMWKAENALLQLGLNTTMFFDRDANANLFFYPKVKAEWSPVKNILTLFADVDGYLQHNTYSTIAAENPYVDPYHDIKNTKYSYIVSGGLKGKLTSRTNYVTQASYSLVKDQHFYYIEAIPSQVLNNTFSVKYDDLKVLKLSAEVLHSVSDNFSLHLSGNYYAYELQKLPKPWQMPNFDLVFSGIYKATDQLIFNADLYFIGSRTGLISGPESSSVPSKEVVMDPIIDLNVGGSYQLSEKLNLFVKLNNFGFQKYEQWLGYTNKGFNWLAGISYSF